jgi:hypothetical protein
MLLRGTVQGSKREGSTGALLCMERFVSSSFWISPRLNRHSHGLVSAHSDFIASANPVYDANCLTTDIFLYRVVFDENFHNVRVYDNNLQLIHTNVLLKGQERFFRPPSYYKLRTFYARAMIIVKQDH